MLATYMLNKIEFAPDDILANQALVVILGPVGNQITVVAFQPEQLAQASCKKIE